MVYGLSSIFIMAAHPELFPITLVLALGGGVKIVIGHIQHVDAARTCGIGVKNATRGVLVKHADSLPLCVMWILCRVVVAHGESHPEREGPAAQLCSGRIAPDPRSLASRGRDRTGGAAL